MKNWKIEMQKKADILELNFHPNIDLLNFSFFFYTNSANMSSGRGKYIFKNFLCSGEKNSKLDIKSQVF